MMRRLEIAGGAAMLCALASGAPAQEMARALEDSYPTNLSMLTDAADAAVGEMLLNFAVPESSSVLLESEADHEARWFIENLLLTRLTESGYVVYLKGGGGGRMPRGAAAEPAPPAGGDSAAAASAPVPETEYVLRYRVAECGLTYPHSYKKSPLGSRTVQRMASVSLFASASSRTRSDVAWVGRGDAERLDLVPSGKLSLLEGKNFPFARPTLVTRGIGVYVEPALVTGIIAGLVYLFYTNQN